MKICVMGLTRGRGLPLALVLRHYGRHSVVGYSLDPTSDRQMQAEISSHPDTLVQDMLRDGAIPVTGMFGTAMREGSDLVIIATPPSWVSGTVDAITRRMEAKGHPVVVVATPLDTARRCATLVAGRRLPLGLAPFGRHEADAADRLLGLRQISILTERRNRDLVGTTMVDAWTPIDNMIPVRVTPINVEGRTVGFTRPIRDRSSLPAVGLTTPSGD